MGKKKNNCGLFLVNLHFHRGNERENMPRDYLIIIFHNELWLKTQLKTLWKMRRKKQD